MKAFADLYTTLDDTNSTNNKIAAMTAYFRSAPAADAAWVIYFLSGRKPRQIVPSRRLVEWATAEAGVPAWLFGESYDAVGDMAETITLLLPDPTAVHDLPLTAWIEERLLPLRAADEATQHAAVIDAWARLTTAERFVYNKLITGAFRVGVSQQLVIRALAAVSGVDAETLAHRMMGTWTPNPAFYAALTAPDVADADASRPYPFCLAYPIEEADLPVLGDAAAWQAEWKWDGIRAQVIRRGGGVYIWTRGEELVTDRYPEIAALAADLPDGTALDGELLPHKNGRVLPFAQLQRRIGRKTLGKKLLADVPVVFLAYDLLEYAGIDLRDRPLADRRSQLEALAVDHPHPALLLSEIVPGGWDALAAARARSRDLGVEGLMLKRRASPYRVGRQRGDWWKWKIAPYTVDAVLINAQRGSGKRASLYSDYTFGVWDDRAGDADRVLVPFAKAYSGLTDDEIRQVDAFIRRNTTEKFGPVRSVTPALVFELAFEGIQRSGRHRSGIAVRFPRILRWRTDKPIHDADTLTTIAALLPTERDEDTDDA